jgi:transcriptional regulator with XRE-family HTH domain
MPRRISAEKDMQILADVGLGSLNKDVAVKYGVSASYVSKLSLGKKVPDIHIPRPLAFTRQEINVHEATLEELQRIIEENQVLANEDEYIKILKDRIKNAIIDAKLYIEMLKKMKGETR